MLADDSHDKYLLCLIYVYQSFNIMQWVCLLNIYLRNKDTQQMKI